MKNIANHKKFYLVHVKNKTMHNGVLHNIGMGWFIMDELLCHEDNHLKNIHFFINKIQEKYPYVKKTHIFQFLLSISLSSFFYKMKNGNIRFVKNASYSIKNKTLFFDFHKFNCFPLNFCSPTFYDSHVHHYVHNYYDANEYNMYTRESFVSFLNKHKPKTVLFISNEDYYDFLCHDVINLNQLSIDEIEALFSYNQKSFRVDGISFINNLKRLPDTHFTVFKFHENETIIKIQTTFELLELQKWYGKPFPFNPTSISWGVNALGYRNCKHIT